ncbi:hypothetical protein [Archaeoglobus sp.]
MFELVLFALLGVVLGAVVVRTDYRNTVLRPLWDAVMNAAVLARSPKEFLKMSWEHGQLLAIAMYKDQKGSLGVVAMVITVIVASIAILIGIIVFANVKASMPTQNLDNETQAMLDTVAQNTKSSFMLLGVGIIVLGAGFILTILIVSLGRAAGQ